MRKETMRRRRAAPNNPVQKDLRSGKPDPAPCSEKAHPRRQAIDIDELSASPWIGLHYRHEFLLHHRHELLKQRRLNG